MLKTQIQSLTWQNVTNPLLHQLMVNKMFHSDTHALMHISMCIGADDCDPYFNTVFDDVLHAIHGNHSAKHVIIGTHR